jgi:hypothetical protein
MEKRIVLTFSLNIDATEPLKAVKAHVEAALGCTLQDGMFFGGPALVGEVLGMQIGLLPWRGIGGVRIYQLRGRPNWQGPRPEEWEEIRIDRAIIDLLRQGGAGEWREPSVEERKAAGDYNLEDI